MENLNAEQIKKELALFIDDMPHQLHLRERKTAEFRDFLKKVLRLFKSLEIELKAMRSAASAYKIQIVELTKQRDSAIVAAKMAGVPLAEGLENVYDFCQKQIEKAKVELLEENKKLAAENEKIGIENFNLVCELSRIREDTVRKMQERLKVQKFTHKNFGELVYVEDIDQIAKELTLAKEERDAENEKEKAF